MNTITKCLFGGALLGAGLSSSAVAGDFVWSLAIADVYTVGDFNTHYDIGNFDVSAFSPFGSANVTADESGLSMSAFAYDFASYSRGGFGHSFAYLLFADFHVTEDMSVTIDWDFSGDYMSYMMVEGNMLTGSGSLELEISAFGFHTISGRVSASAFSTLDGSASTFNLTENTVNVVPLPPAAFGGLAMLAGLGAYRRVRR